MEKRCPSCGRLMEENEKFCQECGAQYVAPQPAAAEAPQIPAMPVMPELPKAPQLTPDAPAVPVVPAAPEAAQTPAAPAAPVSAESPAPAAETPAAPAPAQQFCQNCGNALKPGERFCSRCGTPLAAAAPAAQPIQQSQVPQQPQAPQQPQEPQPQPGTPMKKGSKALIIIPIAAVVLVAALIVCGVFAVKKVLADRKGDLSYTLSALESALEYEWPDDLPSLPDLDDNDEDPDDTIVDPDSWDVYTDSDYNFSIPVPDGWTVEAEPMDGDGMKVVNLFDESMDVGVLMQYVPGGSSSNIIGNEDTFAASVAENLQFSYYSVNDGSDWSFLGNYDAYNFFYIVAEDDTSLVSFCYDCYVIDTDGGAYIIQVYRSTGTEASETEAYSDAMLYAYQATNYMKLS